jgi:hypothetical protein
MLLFRLTSLGLKVGRCIWTSQTHPADVWSPELFYNKLHSRALTSWTSATKAQFMQLCSLTAIFLHYSNHSHWFMSQYTLLTKCVWGRFPELKSDKQNFSSKSDFSPKIMKVHKSTKNYMVIQCFTPEGFSHNINGTFSFSFSLSLSLSLSLSFTYQHLLIKF